MIVALIWSLDCPSIAVFLLGFPNPLPTLHAWSPRTGCEKIWAVIYHHGLRREEQELSDGNQLLFILVFSICSAGEGCEPSDHIHSLDKLRRATAVKSDRLYTHSRSHKASLVVSGVGPELLKRALKHKTTPHLFRGELCLLIPEIHLALPSPKGLVVVRTGSVPWGGSRRDLLLS